MKKISFLFLFLIGTIYLANSQDNERYIEVVGKSNISIKPDKIHFIVTLKEYFKEEFDKKAKPENYKTKIPLKDIESDFIKKIKKIGINVKDINIENIGDYWREPGKDFLISKRFDIVLSDPKKINELISIVDTKGISNMWIGKLENKHLNDYEKKLKTDAAKDALFKAQCLAEALNVKVGKPLRITELSYFDNSPMILKSANFDSDTSIDKIKEISKSYSVSIRFEILDK